MKIKLNEMSRMSNGNSSETNDVKVNYFKLNDGEVRKYRFLFRTANDEFEVYPVHTYKDGRLFKKFHCHREIGGDFNNCPVCSSGGDNSQFWQKQVLFVPLQDVETGEVLIWERSFKFFRDNILEPLFLDTDICDGDEVYSTVFKILRKGTGTDTTYSINKLKTDSETMPDDLEIGDASKYIAKKTESELLEFLRTGQFPKREYNTDSYQKEEPKESTYSTQGMSEKVGYETLSDEDVPF